MIEQAHGEVRVALEELRSLARGIHPAILTERGVAAALANVAGRCTVPVVVDVNLPARPSAAVEGLLYFTTAELLTNISKHSRATSAVVEVVRTGGLVELTVTDDGRGGATPGAGGGLAGLAERVRAMDGVFTLTSPPGGPTVATVRLPWQETAAPGPKHPIREAKRMAKEDERTGRAPRRDPGSGAGSDPGSGAGSDPHRPPTGPR